MSERKKKARRSAKAKKGKVPKRAVKATGALAGAYANKPARAVSWKTAAPLLADHLREYADLHSSLSEKLTPWLLTDFSNANGGIAPKPTDDIPSALDDRDNLDSTCDRLKAVLPSWGVNAKKFTLQGGEVVDDINAQKKALKGAWPKVSWLIGYFYQHVLAARVA